MILFGLSSVVISFSAACGFSFVCVVACVLVNCIVFVGCLLLHGLTVRTLRSPFATISQRVLSLVT